MFFWMREIAGWLLLCVSLWMIYVGIGFVSDTEKPQIVQAGMVLFAATGVLRIGVLLIRVSTAARIVQRDVSQAAAETKVTA